jgi:hypothetical protein
MKTLPQPWNVALAFSALTRGTEEICVRFFVERSYLNKHYGSFSGGTTAQKTFSTRRTNFWPVARFRAPNSSY